MNKLHQDKYSEKERVSDLVLYAVTYIAQASYGFQQAG